MTSKRKVYFNYLFFDNTKLPIEVGRGCIVFHIQGHPNCTPNHSVFTSDIVKIYKNGNFETKNSHWFLVKD